MFLIIKIIADKLYKVKVYCIHSIGVFLSLIYKLFIYFETIVTNVY